MDWGRLLLCALVILAPPAAYAIWIVIYNATRRAQQRADRPTVADIAERLKTEQDNDEHPDEETKAPPLPPGWHWLPHDHDQS